LTPKKSAGERNSILLAAKIEYIAGMYRLQVAPGALIEL
jgi:hypothetical protein